MESTKVSSLSKSFTWSGNRTSHGFAYEKDLAFTLFVAASLEERRFRLATEMNVAGKFDDDVLILDDRKEVWFFQAKHSQTSNAKIEYKEFFPSSYDENSQFSLPMYIQSFLNISKRSEFKHYNKRFIIFTNKSIDENTTHKLEELVDIKSFALNDSLENKVFFRRTEIYEPKAEKIQELLNKVNELPVAVKDAIIELQRSGTVKSILRKYITPLRSILKIDSSVRFSETFTAHADEINQRWLWHELQAHFINKIGKTIRLSEVVFNNKIEKRLLQNKSGETSFPRFIEESDLRSFFECLVICTDQPDKLSPLRDNIIESVVGKWLVVSDRAKFHVVFEKEFENWHMVTNLNGNQKPFLSSYEGNMCVQMTKAEVRRILQKNSAADFSNYVERKLVLENGQEKCTEDEFISMLEQSHGRKDYILVGEPGMGKTTFMQKITHRLQADFNKHVYLICLSRLFHNFKTGKEILTLIKSATSKSIQQLIQKSLENCPQQCFILLDGFDEIDTLHQGSAIKLIKEMFCKNDTRVFISGRNHVKETLEKELQVKALNLVPLVEDEQLMLLRNCWGTISEIEKNDFHRFKTFAKHLLKVLHDNIQSAYFRFTGLPLVVRMLAEVYKENFEKYWKSSNEQIKEILDSENRFSMLHLYENFVNISFNIFIKKINIEEGYTTVDSKIIKFFKDDLEKFHYAHQVIAVEQIHIPKLRETLSNGTYVEILENIQNILGDREKSLLINISNINQLEFTHWSYAEYFVSKYMYAHASECEAFLSDVLKKEKVVRAFFFSIIEENWNDSSLQMDTLNKICYMDTEIIYLACSDGYELILRELLTHHETRVTFCSHEDGTLVHAAVESKRENILKLVLCEHRFGDCTHHEANCSTMKSYETEININTSDSRGALPIHYAVHNGNKPFVKMLAQHGADKTINARDNGGDTPLHFAAQNGDLDMIKMLIDTYSADYKIVNNEGHTVMHLMAKNGYMETVMILFDDYTADVNAQDKHGDTPLHLAAENYEWEMVKMILTKYTADCAIANENGETLIHLAAERGNVEILEMLINDYAADINAQDNNGNTPLHLAASNDEWETVEVILTKYSANCKIANNKGQTLIYLAAVKGCIKIVMMLVDDYAADVNARDQNGNTPFHLAAQNDEWKMVEMILTKYSADCGIANENGETLIHLAAEKGNVEYIEMLINNFAADINAQDNDGNTPLHLAAKNDKWEMIQMILTKYSANFKISNKNGQTLIYLAAAKGNIKLLKMLIDNYAADVNVQDKYGNTPLHLAAQNDEWDMVKIILKKYSADFEITNQNGQTLIHLAADRGNLEIVKMLIDDYAADINAQDTVKRIVRQKRHKTSNKGGATINLYPYW